MLCSLFSPCIELVQDAMMIVEKSRDFLVLMKSMIIFVRNSPKRLFNDLHIENNLPSKSLRPFCPTRWCRRIVPLKTVYLKYGIMIEFLKLFRMRIVKLESQQRGFLKR